MFYTSAYESGERRCQPGAIFEPVPDSTVFTLWIDNDLKKNDLGLLAHLFYEMRKCRRSMSMTRTERLIVCRDTHFSIGQSPDGRSICLSHSLLRCPTLVSRILIPHVLKRSKLAYLSDPLREIIMAGLDCFHFQLTAVHGRSVSRKILRELDILKEESGFREMLIRHREGMREADRFLAPVEFMEFAIDYVRHQPVLSEITADLMKRYDLQKDDLEDYANWFTKAMNRSRLEEMLYDPEEVPLLVYDDDSSGAEVGSLASNVTSDSVRVEVYKLENAGEGLKDSFSISGRNITIRVFRMRSGNPDSLFARIMVQRMLYHLQNCPNLISNLRKSSESDSQFKETVLQLSRQLLKYPLSGFKSIVAEEEVFNVLRDLLGRITYLQTTEKGYRLFEEMEIPVRQSGWVTERRKALKETAEHHLFQAALWTAGIAETRLEEMEPGLREFSSSFGSNMLRVMPPVDFSVEEVVNEAPLHAPTIRVASAGSDTESENLLKDEIGKIVPSSSPVRKQVTRHPVREAVYRKLIGELDDRFDVKYLDLMDSRGIADPGRRQIIVNMDHPHHIDSGGRRNDAGLLQTAVRLKTQMMGFVNHEVLKDIQHDLPGRTYEQGQMLTYLHNFLNEEDIDSLDEEEIKWLRLDPLWTVESKGLFSREFEWSRVMSTVCASFNEYLILPYFLDLFKRKLEERQLPEYENAVHKLSVLCKDGSGVMGMARRAMNDLILIDQRCGVLIMKPENLYEPVILDETLKLLPLS